MTAQRLPIVVLVTVGVKAVEGPRGRTTVLGADDAVDAVRGVALFVNAVLQEPSLLFRMAGKVLYTDPGFRDQVRDRLAVEVYEHVFENPARRVKGQGGTLSPCRVESSLTLMWAMSVTTLKTVRWND